MKENTGCRQVTLATTVAWALLIGVASAGSGPADDRVGAMRFQEPAGWRKTDLGQAVLYNAPRVPYGQRVELAVWRGVPLGNDLQQTLDLARLQFRNGAKLIRESRVASQRMGGYLDEFDIPQDSYDVLSYFEVMQTATGSLDYRFYWAAHIPGESRMELIAYSASAAALYNQYAPAVEELLTSVVFAKLEARKREAERNRAGAEKQREEQSKFQKDAEGTIGSGLSGGGLNPHRNVAPVQFGSARIDLPEERSDPFPSARLYVSNVTTTRLNMLTNRFETRVEHLYWLLLPGKGIYFGLPTGAWDEVNFDRLQREQPGRCGRCEESGDTIRFQYNGYSIALRSGQQAVTIPGRILTGQAQAQTEFRRVASCDGFQLEGVFESTSVIATGPIYRGTDTNLRRYTFLPNGRFRFEQVVFGALDSTKTQTFSRTEVDRSGSYRIADNVLVLTVDPPASPATERLGVFRLPGEEEKILVVGGQYFIRR